MTFREMNRRIFHDQPTPHVLFQPRFEPWFLRHQERGTLPERFRDSDVYDAYDSLGVSMRYIAYSTGCPMPVRGRFDPAVNVHSHEDEKGMTVVHETPKGTLTSHYGRGEDGLRQDRHPVQNADDLEALLWLLERMTYEFDEDAFRAGAERMGDRGEPQFFVPRSPYQAMALDWMRYEDFAIAMMEASERFETAFQCIERAADPLYEQLCGFDEAHIINFGENVDARLVPRAHFEEYLIPFYARRGGQLREAGKKLTIHLDGSLAPLLPVLSDIPVDGLEALTPHPQGDVTIEEIHGNMGDKILLDGIPAVLFLAEFPVEHLQACVEDLVNRFAPRLVLGISDELPMGAGPEAVERMEWVARYCERAT
jgi:hypothetical protein